MNNLEQTIEGSFFGQIKKYVGRVRSSIAGKLAVYSLAGILGAGLGYGCEQPKDSNDNSNSGWNNNRTNDNNGGSNSGKGGYCDSCDSYSDCEEGWECFNSLIPSFSEVYVEAGFQATFCVPSVECTSDSQCDGYRCNDVKVCSPRYDVGCDVNHNIWFKSHCGDEMGIKECTGGYQCQNLKECGGNIICSDAGIFWHDKDTGDEYACAKVTIKDNGN